jgi:hypothetical protein
LAATLDNNATSSRMVAMSSINASRLLAMFFTLQRQRLREQKTVVSGGAYCAVQ